jgi:hypothetical protein
MRNAMTTALTEKESDSTERVLREAFWTVRSRQGAVVIELAARVSQRAQP